MFCKNCENYKTCLVSFENILSVPGLQHNLTIDIDCVVTPHLSAGGDADTVPDPCGPEIDYVPVGFHE